MVNNNISGGADGVSGRDNAANPPGRARLGGRIDDLRARMAEIRANVGIGNRAAARQRNSGSAASHPNTDPNPTYKGAASGTTQRMANPFHEATLTTSDRLEYYPSLVREAGARARNQPAGIVPATMRRTGLQTTNQDRPTQAGSSATADIRSESTQESRGRQELERSRERAAARRQRLAALETSSLRTRFVSGALRGSRDTQPSIAALAAEVNRSENATGGAGGRAQRPGINPILAPVLERQTATVFAPQPSAPGDDALARTASNFGVQDLARAVEASLTEANTAGAPSDETDDDAVSLS